MGMACTKTQHVEGFGEALAVPLAGECVRGMWREASLGKTEGNNMTHTPILAVPQDLCTGCSRSLETAFRVTSKAGSRTSWALPCLKLQPAPPCLISLLFVL